MKKQIKIIVMFAIASFIFSGSGFAQFIKGQLNAAANSTSVDSLKKIVDSAHSFAEDDPRIIGIENPRESVGIVVNVPPQPMRDWVVMIYSNVKNNLDYKGLYAAANLEQAGSNDKTAFVIEIGRVKEHALETTQRARVKDYWTGNRRYYITKTDSDTPWQQREAALTSPLIWQGKSDMGDYRNVAAFVKWTKERFPAKHYMLIMQSHGSGFKDGKQTTVAAPSKTKGVSFDDETNNYVRTRQMGAMLQTMKGIDVFATDACLMQMAEILYEVGRYAKFVVGSQELHRGFDYEKIGKVLTSSPLSPKAAAKALVEATAQRDIYADEGLELTISAIDTSKLPNLYTALDKWALAVMKLPKEKVRFPLGMAKSNIIRFADTKGRYWSSNYGDMFQFVEWVTTDLNNTAVTEAFKNFKKAFSEAVVLAKGAGTQEETGLEYSLTGGIAVGIPPRDLKEDSFEGLEQEYREYRFVKISQWGKFYAWMTEMLLEDEEAVLSGDFADNDGF